MTFAPPSLLDARAYLKSRTGLTSVELGITGDPDHAAKGTSYHLGKDQLTDDAYSRRTARDRAGLSNAASALDIGMFARLREMSVWLVGQCRANAPDTRDIREVIYSPDGKVVWRWDRERGVTSQPRTGEASNSHLTHTHVSWYRDSEFRDRTAVFRRFFEGDDMPLSNDDVDRIARRVWTWDLLDGPGEQMAYKILNGVAAKPGATPAEVAAAIKAERQALVAELVPAIVAALPDDGPVNADAVETALRRVLGGVDGATPDQVPVPREG
jgi:hypothetical protein